MGLNYEGETGEIRTDAYHGTDLASAESILRSGFIPQLGIAGVGAYFDLGDDSSARERALEKAGGSFTQAVVIQAEVHLGKTIELNFELNPQIKAEFQQFQKEIEQRFGGEIPMNFSQQKELFIQERYPEIHSASYFRNRQNQLTVAVRDSKRIKILSVVTLTGRVLQ